jgi:hypothetical protein
MTQPLNDSNAEELAHIAEETGALVLRGWLRYPSGDWQPGDQVLGEFLYPFRERQVVLIQAPVGGEPVHLCGVCGFALERPGQDCPRCATSNERDGAIIQERQDLVGAAAVAGDEVVLPDEAAAGEASVGQWQTQY